MATLFDDFVNQQHKMAGDTERSVDWPRQLDEWKRFLEQFNDLVKEFLREYIEQGKMRIEYVAKQIHEQHTGRYEVQAISIVIGNNKVYLDPIGTNLIAAKGRVDMNGPSGTVRFVLVPKDSPHLTSVSEFMTELVRYRTKFRRKSPNGHGRLLHLHRKSDTSNLKKNRFATRSWK